MTPAEWKELKAAQRVLEHPARHSHAMLDEATDRFTVLSAQAFAEVGETMRQLGARLQRELDAVLPAVRRFVDACVEAGILEAPTTDMRSPQHVDRAGGFFVASPDPLSATARGGRRPSVLPAALSL